MNSHQECSIVSKFITNIQERNKNDRHRALTNVMKELIQKLIFEKFISRPKKLSVGVNKAIEISSMKKMKYNNKYLNNFDSLLDCDLILQ